MSNSIYVNYVIFGIYDIIDIYGIGHMSWINMVIWVSKEPSRPQDCSQMSEDAYFNLPKMSVIVLVVSCKPIVGWVSYYPYWFQYGNLSEPFMIVLAVVTDMRH